MAKGNRGGRRGGGGGLSPGDIVSTVNLHTSNKVDKQTYSEISNALNDFSNKYGLDTRNTREAELKGKGKSALAYYDGAGIAFNSDFMESNAMNKAYDTCVRSGFHPPRGNKSALEAVAAHELGHYLTDAVAVKMGLKGYSLDIDVAAKRICEEARKITKDRGVVIMSKKISGYAEESNAEAVAEAVADVYCNGSKASAASKAIQSVIDKYLQS